MLSLSYLLSRICRTGSGFLLAFGLLSPATVLAAGGGTGGRRVLADVTSNGVGIEEHSAVACLPSRSDGEGWSDGKRQG